jgi:hypothetical protein
MSDYRRGFGLDIGFIDHLQVVTTNNYDIVADFHTLQITTAHAKSFPACSVFARLFLVTASNKGYSSASVLKSSLNGCRELISGTKFKASSVGELVNTPCGGGGVEYFHRSPASRRRPRKGNPVPGGITGPPCSWGI